MKAIVLILLTGVCTHIYADVMVKPQIKEVVVYTSNALITSTAKANVTKGCYNLIFENVSPYIDENTIQIYSKSDLTILSISIKRDYLNEREKDPTLNKLEDSAGVVRKRISQLSSRQVALSEELNFLKANQKVSGNNSVINAIDLEKVANFYLARIEEINNQQFDLTLQQSKHQEKLNAIENQITSYRAENSLHTSDVIVNVKSNTAGEVDFELSYMVGNAGWTPSYDIRTAGLGNTVSFYAKANVWQNTGENWKDVTLTISTGNPSKSNVMPAFTPSYVVLYPEYQIRRKSINRSFNAPALMQSAAPVNKGSAEYDKAEDREDVTSFTLTDNIETTTNNFFVAPIAYSIKGDGKSNSVELQKYEVQATYRYISRPKNDLSVFLVAQIVDWNQSGLLSGDANVYFDGSYVGKTYFDANLAVDTMTISFGRDNNINIQRKRIKFLNDKSIVANTKSIEVGIEISVKNKKKTDIDLIIEDQIPISQNTNTTVEDLELSQANYHAETGKLKWATTLKPGDIKQFKFGFKVKYPKGNSINTDF